VFDSGIGGLSVLAEIRRLRPDVAALYVADSAHAPYGERSADEVRVRAEAIAAALIDRGCSPIVVACNTASAVSLDHLRTVFPTVPFVGMEPAVKPAAGLTRRGMVGVMATERTFQAERFAAVVERYARDVSVVARACPGLAAAIEAGDDAETDRLVRDYVGGLVARGVDTVVLGCTHYSLVADRIRAAAGEATIVDPAAAVARQAVSLSEEVGAGPIRYLTTGDPDRLRGRLGEVLARLPTLDGEPLHVARLET